MKSRLSILRERVELIYNQIKDAVVRGDDTSAKSVLFYWLGVIYDEGIHQGKRDAEDRSQK